MENRQALLHIFPGGIREVLGRLNLNYEKLQEIRLRSERPIAVLWDGKEYFVKKSGEATVYSEDGYCPGSQEMMQIMECVSGYSMYAFEEELRQGFLTIQGGHRIGISGKVLLEHGKVKNIRHIAFIHIRLCHQIPGCADALMPYLTEKENVYHTLIISPPGAGKTTLLRDVIRQISNGIEGCAGKNVAVVDERSELAGSYYGVPQNDLGIRTDILDGCPKAEGMMMMIRSMAPEVIAVDEIGTEEDRSAIETASCCGCKVLATVHGSSVEDIQRNPCIQRLCEEKTFERYVVLNREYGKGHIQAIYDGTFRRLL